MNDPVEPETEAPGGSLPLWADPAAGNVVAEAAFLTLLAFPVSVLLPLLAKIVFRFVRKQRSRSGVTAVDIEYAARFKELEDGILDSKGPRA